VSQWIELKLVQRWKLFFQKPDSTLNLAVRLVIPDG